MGCRKGLRERVGDDVLRVEVGAVSTDGQLYVWLVLVDDVNDVVGRETRKCGIVQEGPGKYKYAVKGLRGRMGPVVEFVSVRSEDLVADADPCTLSKA